MQAKGRLEQSEEHSCDGDSGDRACPTIGADPTKDDCGNCGKELVRRYASLRSVLVAVVKYSSQPCEQA